MRDYRNNNRKKNYKQNNNPIRYGINTVEIDQKKIKTVNEEAIKRSEFNNKIVDKMVFYSRTGKYCTISGNQLLYFTLTPTSPLIDCPHIRLKMTYGGENNKEPCTTRLCNLNNKDNGGNLEICQMSIQKIADGKCIGKKFQGASIEFWIITNGYMEEDDNKREVKIVFLNKNLQFENGGEFRDNKDPIKSKGLWNLYNSIKTGNVKVTSIPKPGNILFHTLFSGIVDVDIETITGEELKGTVKGYEFTPGGHPSLNLWIGDKLRIIPLYTISVMVVKKYDLNDILSRRVVELTLNGHIVIPHRMNNKIYDYCKRNKMDKDQEITLDGMIKPLETLDKHDIELQKLIMGTK